MKGFPKTIATKADLLNVVDMARREESGIEKDDAIRFLDNLVATKQHLVLKADAAEKPAEEQTPDDYELVDNANSQMARLGLTEDEINELKGGLQS